MLLFKKKIWKKPIPLMYENELKSGENALLGNKLLSLRHTRPKIVNLWHKKNYQKNYYVIKSLEKPQCIDFSFLFLLEISCCSLPSIIRTISVLIVTILISRIWINVITILIDMFQKKTRQSVHRKDLHRSICKLWL